LRLRWWWRAAVVVVGNKPLFSRGLLLWVLQLI
jgi:hypothetical protein